MSQDEDEKRATEQLLSGFDRPGRTPRTPRVRSRDFVDHYSGKSPAIPEAPPPSSRREETGSHQRATVLVPRRNGVRAVTTWVVAVVGMILFGATIAVLSTPEMPASPSNASSPGPSFSAMTPTPTSATTITSATPTAPEGEPIQEPAVAPTRQAPPPKKSAPTTLLTTGASTTPAIKTAPRDDFIRDL